MSDLKLAKELFIFFSRPLLRCTRALPTIITIFLLTQCNCSCTFLRRSSCCARFFYVVFFIFFFFAAILIFAVLLHNLGDWTLDGLFTKCSVKQRLRLRHYIGLQRHTPQNQEYDAVHGMTLARRRRRTQTDMSGRIEKEEELQRRSFRERNKMHPSLRFSRGCDYHHQQEEQKIGKAHRGVCPNLECTAQYFIAIDLATRA